MFSSSWMGGFPMANVPDVSYKYSNFEIYFGPGSVMSAPLLKQLQNKVVISNLPFEATTSMIKELLRSPPLQIQPSAVKDINWSHANNKCSCEIEFDMDVNASLVNSIHTWYMRINNIQDESHESKMIVEYCKPVFPECNETTLEKLKDDLSLDENDSTFREALKTLEYWLEEGEVHKRNNDIFISLLYLVYKKVNNLNNEKMKSDTEIHDAKKGLKTKVEALSSSLKDLKMVLSSASQKKVWDHFSKPQRKNLDAWVKEVDDLHEQYSKELLSQREEDEMDLDENEKENMEIPDSNTISSLKDELDALLNQKATLESELNEIKREKNEELARNQTAFRETLRDIALWKEKLEDIKKDLSNANVRTEEINQDNVTVVSASDSTTNPEPVVPEASLSLSGQDVHQLGLITSFLNLHINGANIEYLTSFLKDSGQTVSPEDVEELMRRFPNMFTEVTVGIGADMRKFWKYSWPARSSE